MPLVRGVSHSNLLEYTEAQDKVLNYNFEDCKLLCLFHTGHYLSIVVIQVFILEIFIEIFILEIFIEIFILEIFIEIFLNSRFVFKGEIIY